MPESKKCSDCGKKFPLTREHFGQVKSLNGIIYFRGICRACMRARAAAHHAANPEMKAERAQRRRSAESAMEGYHTEDDIAKIRRKLKDCCRYCGTDLGGKGEIDHIVPVTRGGTNWPTNLTLSCGACNRNKGNRTLEEYEQYRAERGLKMRRR